MTSKYKTLLLEFGAIAEQNAAIMLVTRSFGPQLQPYGYSALLLDFASFDNKTSEFSNPSNFKPKRTLFVRDSPNSFRIRVEFDP